MPAIMPPINPNLLLGLLRNIPGIAPVPRTFGTPGINPNAPPPPGYGGGGGGRGGGMAERGAYPGTPAAPTPGLVRPTLGESIGSVTPGSAPSATAKPAGKQNVKTTYDPDGGWVEEDPDGTKEVFDKNGKMLDRISPPGSAGYGVPWQPPAEAKKPGIWDRLTDPSLAGIALAAGQQLTRPRYPGETATGNAVSAVTAGYNTLAQQRQLQYAREQAELERKAKEAKAAQDKLESEARIGGIKSESERRAAQSAKDRADARRDAAQAEIDRYDKDQNRVLKGREVATGEKKATTDAAQAEALKKKYESDAEDAKKAAVLAEAKFKQAVYEFGTGRMDKNKFDKVKLELEERRTKAMETQAAAAMARAGNTQGTKFISQATRNVQSRLNRLENEARAKGTTWYEPDPSDTEDEIIRLADKMARGEVGPEPEAVLGPTDYGPPRSNLGPAVAPGQVTEGKDPKTGHAIVLGPNNQWLDKRTGKPIPQ